MANLYPTHLLDECETGLCLFGAGFLGKNDSVHMKDRQFKEVTIVDNDVDKLAQMKLQSPAHWQFTVADVTSLDILLHPNYLEWDIVSVDPPIALISWCMENIDKFLALCRKYLILTTYLDNVRILQARYPVTDVVIRSATGGTVVVAMSKPS